MENVEALYGTTIHFDREVYPFDQIFLQVCKQALADDGHHLSQLSRLHEACLPETLGRLYSRCYEFMDTKVFLDLYRTFIRDVVQPVLGHHFYYQKKPGFRVHLHNTLTVQYHTDE